MPPPELDYDHLGKVAQTHTNHASVALWRGGLATTICDLPNRGALKRYGRSDPKGPSSTRPTSSRAGRMDDRRSGTRQRNSPRAVPARDQGSYTQSSAPASSRANARDCMRTW
ncbi:hypothetical protein SCAR479_14011 [Seiridium cardinale]|uniref:Uncharacterized protein n=1 Tax=Seiridium cardinale TaxID=138064 RepID=A0ABR2X6B7_9PEZI